MSPGRRKFILNPRVFSGASPTCVEGFVYDGRLSRNPAVAFGGAGRSSQYFQPAISSSPSNVEALAAENSHGEAIFRIRGVSKVSTMGEVEVHALRSVDLDLFEGELAVLLGASGSGKSTLLNIIGGLDVPTSGRVEYRDHVLTEAIE
jgi:ABC-type glutathione transport system ATPase component